MCRLLTLEVPGSLLDSLLWGLELMFQQPEKLSLFEHRILVGFEPVVDGSHLFSFPYINTIGGVLTRLVLLFDQTQEEE